MRIDAATWPEEPATPPSAAPSAPIALKTDALLRRATFLSEEGQAPTILELEALQGKNDLVEINFIDRIQLASKSVGRIILRTSKGTDFATAFLVAPGILMTNHHVLHSSDEASNAVVEFDYRVDVAGKLETTKRFALDPASIFVTDEALDFTACGLAPVSQDGGTRVDAVPHVRLIPRTGKVIEELDYVTIPQHPDGAPMQIALRENKVTRVRDGESVIWYEADTAHGSSGAPVLNDSMQVAALHSSGRIKRDDAGRYCLKSGGVVESLAGLRESDVLWESNIGIRVSAICTFLVEWQKGAGSKGMWVDGLFDRTDVMTSAVVASALPSGTAIAPMPDTSPAVARVVPESKKTQATAGHLSDSSGTAPKNMSRTINAMGSSTLPIRLTLLIGGNAGEAAALQGDVVAPEVELEARKLQVPAMYDGLESREGFDEDFLKLESGPVPMPTLTASGKKVAAPLLEEEGFILKYSKFSAIVHKGRRLPLIAASNVDWTPGSRPVNPATGKKYSRAELTEVPENVGEQWVLDPRISERHQLPDTFYTDDRSAFDKGHIVRRDDVAWGQTFKDAQISNGDTYHVTNCTPQILGFNRSPNGDENWGDFENEVQKATKADKVIIFAGPILAEKDRWFEGVDDTGGVRIQVPKGFWKIVVAKGVGGQPEVHGFVLEQDVMSITEKELLFDAKWNPMRKSVEYIAERVRGWLDFSYLAQFDAFKKAKVDA